MADETFDFVIVGAGAAGCVLANRLSENPANSVALVEAGPRDLHPYLHMPAGFIKMLFNPSYTWQFKTEPSDGSNGRSIPMPQGRTLGGSTAINGFVYNRGQAADYDGWAQMGNRGWGYEDVLPFFRKTERRIGEGDDAYRGRSGGLPVENVRWPHPLCTAFVEGAQTLGIPYNNDYNGASQAGVGTYQTVIHRGMRNSAARSFLRPVRNRPNLRVFTNAQVERILFSQRRATGISVVRPDGTRLAIAARREVIVSAGPVNSPKLLQISGVGPSALLSSIGVEPVAVLEGVGENLRDHWAARIVGRVKGVRTINRTATGLSLVGQAARWMLGQPSVLALSPSIIHLFWKSDPALSGPDLQMTFTPASYQEGVVGLLDSQDGMTCGVWQDRPESLGYVRARSSDVREAPEIQPNYLSNSIDRAAIIGGVKLAEQLLETAPMQPYFAGRVSPGKDVKSDDEIIDFVRAKGSTVFHLMGSCRMGPASDRRCVVDDRLRVHGTEGLRVIDSSIMPSMPSGNTMAATYMIAEKGADMILRGLN